MTKLRFVFAAALASLTLTGVAAADVDDDRQTDDGQYYKFTDDPLNSDAAGDQGWRITVRRDAARVMLIRPRTSFVPEMFKSVENI